MYTFTERCYLTVDGEVVPAGDESARWLLGVPGGQIPLVEAERYGLKAPAKSKRGKKKAAEPVVKAEDGESQSAKRSEAAQAVKDLRDEKAEKGWHKSKGGN